MKQHSSWRRSSSASLDPVSLFHVLRVKEQKGHWPQRNNKSNSGVAVQSHARQSGGVQCLLMQEMETFPLGKGSPQTSFHLSCLFVIFCISQAEGMRPRSAGYVIYLETDWHALRRALMWFDCSSLGVDLISWYLNHYHFCRFDLNSVWLQRDSQTYLPFMFYILFTFFTLLLHF